jgi:hypothetical protein
MPAKKNEKPKNPYSVPLMKLPNTNNGLDFKSRIFFSKANSKMPDWYKIPDVSRNTFIDIMKPFYDIIEGKKPSMSKTDSFAIECWKAVKNLSDEQFLIEQEMIQKNRAWTMAWGNFHQALMGSFKGWQNLKQGHESKCDIRRTDNTCYGEIKNHVNTMNSGGKESVYGKLKKHVKLGRRTLLVIVNGTKNTRIENLSAEDYGIEWITGRKFYQELSGRSTFFEDLLTTTVGCFTRFKTHSEMIQGFFKLN